MTVSLCADITVPKPYLYRTIAFVTIVGVALMALGLLFLLSKGHPLPPTATKIFLGLGTLFMATSGILSIFCCFKRNNRESQIIEEIEPIAAEKEKPLPIVEGSLYIENPKECDLYKDIVQKNPFADDIHCLDKHEWKKDDEIVINCGLNIKGEKRPRNCFITAYLLVQNGNLARPKSDGNFVEFVSQGKRYHLVIDQKNAPLKGEFETAYRNCTRSTREGGIKLQEVYKEYFHKAPFQEKIAITKKLIQKESPIKTYGTNIIDNLPNLDKSEWSKYRYKNSQMIIEAPGFQPSLFTVFEFNDYFLIHFYRESLETASMPCFVLMPKSPGFQSYQIYKQGPESGTIHLTFS